VEIHHSSPRSVVMYSGQHRSIGGWKSRGRSGARHRSPPAPPPVRIECRAMAVQRITMSRDRNLKSAANSGRSSCVQTSSPPRGSPFPKSLSRRAPDVYLVDRAAILPEARDGKPRSRGAEKNAARRHVGTSTRRHVGKVERSRGVEAMGTEEKSPRWRTWQ
jgi:hypothetical protein